MSGRPDWILLDLMLPDGIGLDLLREIQPPSARERVCVITGCGPELQHQARDAGASHVFVKPLDIDALLAVLLGIPVTPEAL